MRFRNKFIVAISIGLINFSFPALAEENSDKNISLKMNTYISCFNQNKDVTRSIQRYSQWVKDMKKGPTGKEKIVYGLYNVNVDKISKCQKDITEVAVLEPIIPTLDDDAVLFANTQLAVAENIKAMYPYYNQEDYKDDKLAKGKEMHVEFAKNADAFLTANQKLSASISSYNDQRQLDQLKKIEKEQGRNDQYYGLAILLEAKKLLAIVTEDTFKPEDAQAEIEKYSALLEEAEKFVADNSDLKRSLTKNLLSEAKNVLKTSKDRYRRVRDKEAYSKTERSWLGTSSGWMVKGGPDVIIRDYNKLVSRFNAYN
jgi:hypothetical protein